MEAVVRVALSGFTVRCGEHAKHGKHGKHACGFSVCVYLFRRFLPVWAQSKRSATCRDAARTSHRCLLFFLSVASYRFSACSEKVCHFYHRVVSNQVWSGREEGISDQVDFHLTKRLFLNKAAAGTNFLFIYYVFFLNKNTVAAVQWLCSASGSVTVARLTGLY